MAAAPLAHASRASASEDMGDESAREYYDIVSKTFASEDDAFEFYNSYALEKGFSLRKSYVEWDEANQEIILRKLVCSRQGSREEKHMKREDRKRRPRHLTRVGCRAKLAIAKLKATGQQSDRALLALFTWPSAPAWPPCRPPPPSTTSLSRLLAGRASA